MAKTKSCQITFTKGKGWKICGKPRYYKSFNEATKAFKGKIRYKANGYKPLQTTKVGRRYVYAKLGGWKGALEDVLFGRLGKELKKEERSYLRQLQRKASAQRERKVQKRLTQFGFRVPVSKSQSTPYAFGY